MRFLIFFVLLLFSFSSVALSNDDNELQGYFYSRSNAAINFGASEYNFFDQNANVLHQRGYAVGGAVGYLFPLSENKFWGFEVEVNRSAISPKFDKLDFIHGTFLMDNVHHLGELYEGINLSQVETLFRVSQMSFLLNNYYRRNFTDNLGLYLGLGLGSSWLHKYFNGGEYPISRLGVGLKTMLGVSYSFKKVNLNIGYCSILGIWPEQYLVEWMVYDRPYKISGVPLRAINTHGAEVSLVIPF